LEAGRVVGRVQPQHRLRAPAVARCPHRVGPVRLRASSVPASARVSVQLVSRGTQSSRQQDGERGPSDAPHDVLSTRGRTRGLRARGHGAGAVAGGDDRLRASVSVDACRRRPRAPWLALWTRASEQRSAEYERAQTRPRHVSRCARERRLHDAHEGTERERLGPCGQGRRTWRHEDASRSARSSISSLPS